MRIHLPRLTLCVLIGVGARAGAAPPTFQGKPLSAWMEALNNDLDPQYRKLAVRAIASFGKPAFDPLVSLLEANRSPEFVTLATEGLVRLGPAGRVVVGRRLATAPRSSLLHVIRGIGEAGSAGRAFMPHLRTLANSPELSLVALRVLSQLQNEPEAPADLAVAASESAAPGVRLTMEGGDCFVSSRFSAVSARVNIDPGTRITRARVYFMTALDDEGALYYVNARVVGPTEGVSQTYQAVLPKPMLEATTVSYWFSIETPTTKLRTPEVVAGVSPTEEGCVLAGSTPVPMAPADHGPISAFSAPKK